MIYADIRRIIDECVVTLGSCPDAKSPLGGQLESLRLGMTGKADEHLRYSRAQAKLERRAVLILVWNLLDAEEQRVMILARTPISAVTKPVSLWATDLQPDDAYVRRDPDFEGKVIVERIFPQYPRYHEIGQAMGLTARQVETRVSEAYRKITRSRLVEWLAL